MEDPSHVKTHFKETERLVRQIPSQDVASWLLNQGYFPELYVLPPSFQASNFTLQEQAYNQDFFDFKKRELISISHPKTLLTSRVFSIQHPWNYHDIVYHLEKEWQSVLDHIFDSENKIYSYSIPIPVSKHHEKKLSNLRSGRMIYEWLSMAEKDLILDAVHYKFIARTDITNFYSSVYTHSIAWALEGRKEARDDKSYNLLGNKIDKLYQYSNDGRTNGIPTGSILSDLIGEIILASIDKKISKQLKEYNIKFLAARFKDDYRFLCESESDATRILKIVAANLSTFNLTLNETKTSILKMPDGLYRKHDRQYFPHSLSGRKIITFKVFEHTLLIAIDIHRQNPGTSILEKFLSEIFHKKNRKLKIVFSASDNKNEQEIYKIFSLLFLAERESEKLLCHVLSIIEELYKAHIKKYPKLKPYLQSIIKSSVSRASDTGSIFEVVWLIFFSRYIGLGIEPKELVKNEEVKKNPFYQSILNSRQMIFNDTKIVLFKTPQNCKEKTLAEHLDIFNRED